MIAALVVLCTALFVLAGFLAYACHVLSQALADNRTERASLIDRVLSSLGDIERRRNQVTVLRQMADRWDSHEEQPVLQRLADEEFVPGGPSMPVIWLRYQADRLEQENDKDIERIWSA